MIVFYDDFDAWLPIICKETIRVILIVIFLFLYNQIYHRAIVYHVDYTNAIALSLSTIYFKLANNCHSNKLKISKYGQKTGKK